MQRAVSLLLRFALIVGLGVVSLGVIGTQLLPSIGGLGDAASFEPTSNLALPELAEGSTVLDSAGEPMGQLVGSENRVVVPLDEMSDELQRTVLAVEDADFYRHDGVSARSVLRAVQANSAAGEISQGGSTITQQLVKLSLVGDDRTIGRKIEEASLAIQLENQFCRDTTKRDCKNRILEQYLNLVYLGRGTYGVEAASQLYFGIPASEVGWAEAAVLTSLIRNPTGYDPIRFPEVADERREIVLGRMVDEGLVNSDEAELIAALPLPDSEQATVSAATSQDLSYWERKVRDELLDAEWLAPTEELRRFLIFNGGLTITSTMDPRAQLLAEAASETNPAAALNPESVAVVASVEPTSGAVRAVVGETEIEGRGLVEVADPHCRAEPRLVVQDLHADRCARGGVRHQRHDLLVASAEVVVRGLRPARRRAHLAVRLSRRVHVAAPGDRGVEQLCVRPAPGRRRRRAASSTWPSASASARCPRTRPRSRR